MKYKLIMIMKGTKKFFNKMWSLYCKAMYLAYAPYYMK